MHCKPDLRLLVHSTESVCDGEVASDVEVDKMVKRKLLKIVVPAKLQYSREISDYHKVVGERARAVVTRETREITLHIVSLHPLTTYSAALRALARL